MLACNRGCIKLCLHTYTSSMKSRKMCQNGDISLACTNTHTGQLLFWKKGLSVAAQSCSRVHDVILCEALDGSSCTPWAVILEDTRLLGGYFGGHTANGRLFWRAGGYWKTQIPWMTRPPTPKVTYRRETANCPGSRHKSTFLGRGPVINSAFAKGRNDAINWKSTIHVDEKTVGRY